MQQSHYGEQFSVVRTGLSRKLYLNEARDDRVSELLTFTETDDCNS